MAFGSGTFRNPKDRGGSARGLSGSMNTHQMNFSTSGGTISSGIAGEVRDLPGQHAFQQLTGDYGAGKHEAYDSPLAQPAYSEHGKVRVL